MKHLVSVSGGKDSTATYLLAMERGHDFRAVFADTGNEHPLTYDYVRTLPERTGGPEIEWVTADFAAGIAHKREIVATKWRADGVEEGRVLRALELLQTTGNPFLDLCMMKGRFPSTKARFCTEELKVIPIEQKVIRPMLSTQGTVVSWQGIRADESRARALLKARQRFAHHDDLSGVYMAYRPLLRWTREDVFAFHRKHGIEPNPLYAQGMSRVGCMPCIMARKDELKEIGMRFPSEIERLAEWEALVSEVSKRGSATFFATVQSDPTASATDQISHLTHGVHRMMDWAKTSHGGRQLDLEGWIDADAFSACNTHGACEAA